MTTISRRPATATAAPSRVQPVAPRAPAAPAPTLLDRVRARAFEIFEARRKSGKPGDPVGDWLQAEKECGAAPPAPAVDPNPEQSREMDVLEIHRQQRGESLLHSND